MRKLLVSVVVFLALSAIVAIGNPIPPDTPYGDIDLFADPSGTNEVIYDRAPGLISIYVVHVGSPPYATGSEFWAPKPACFNAVWLSDTKPFPVTIGDSQIGVSIGYGTCRATPIHVLTINYLAQGLTGDCCYYGVHADPASGSRRVLSVDCEENLLEITGGYTIINPKVGGGGVDCPVAVEPVTWGEIKALYAD